MNKTKLKIARNKVDQIDKKIFDLIKERTKIVKYMLSIKKYKRQIIDRKRIDDILKKIKNKSIRYGIDSKLTSRIWKSIIWSYVEFQKKNLKKNNYLLCGGNFFSTNISCLRVDGLYFLILSLFFAFSPVEGFLT